MNPTTDHFHVPERAFTRNNTKKIQVSNQEKNGVTDIEKWLEDLSLVVELWIKTIYECLIFFRLHLITFISDLWLVPELYYIMVIFWAYFKACNIHVWMVEYKQTVCVFLIPFCVILFQTWLRFDV